MARKRLWLRGQAVKTSPFHGGNTGSIPVGVTIYQQFVKVSADVAQLAEQLICNQQVIGSSPIIGFSELCNSDEVIWSFSSVGQSNRLITGRSWVRVPEGPFVTKDLGPVAQLVRASPCHGEGRRFESDLGRLLI